jgi:Fe-S-cluster-containing hydrogenase component 2
LKDAGYQLVGPTVRQDAIGYDRIDSVRDLPEGWTDEQEAGQYRLRRRPDQALFGYAVGAHSWKKYLFPPSLRLWSARRTATGFQLAAEAEPETKYAFIGVRSCELHAIAIQDRVFMGGQYVDSHYRAVRERLFIVAVNCGQAGGTCFCVSMETGPEVKSGFDLALTEVMNDGQHHFVVEVGSERGREVMARLPHREASQDDVDAVSAVVQHTAGQMGRTMDTGGIRDLLYQNAGHQRWDQVASRCLTCANCTLVCPTCFCSTVEDTTDVAGATAQRTRRWDSCFTLEFSRMHQRSVRSSASSRYRQWMTHKLATWFDQFGTSGCVGCGRCITWCPVGIDITEEVRAIRRSHAEGAAEKAETVDRENADA